MIADVFDRLAEFHGTEGEEVSGDDGVVHERGGPLQQARCDEPAQTGFARRGIMPKQSKVLSIESFHWPVMVKSQVQRSTCKIQAAGGGSLFYLATS
jgi:hypothetical protein